MRVAVLWAILGLVAGCGEDLHPCGSAEPDENGQLGGIMAPGGECELCSTTEACQAEYGGGLEAGCSAYCRNGSCFQDCPGTCSAAIDAGSCTPGNRDCLQGEDVVICDQACGQAGGCRSCALDSQCEAELGPGAECQTHCGTCCRPEDTSREDGGVPCFCI